MLHTFQLPSTILQILFLYSAATDSLVVDGAVDSLRALIATVLNLVLGDYGKRRFIRSWGDVVES